MPSRLRAFAVLFLIFISFSIHAQTPAPSKDPVEITADGSLEWHRNDKTFIARGHALARQGESAIEAETLTALYREKQEGGGMDVYTVTAEQGVVLRSKDSSAYGDKADYDLDKGYAVMTGSDLRLVSPDQTVTARDRFEYWVKEGKLAAAGRAKVIRKNEKGETNTLEADTVSAVMKDNAQGQRVLDTLEARGNVVITTPAETVSGAYGIYRADTNKAEMTGGVTILRGPNSLKGDRAEVDMNTNTSQLFGGAASPTHSGQVKGVFYPGSEKKLEEKGPAR